MGAVAEVNVPLALHCLADVGSVNSPKCPIITERTLVLSNPCEGLGIRDTLFDFLVQAIREAEELRVNGPFKKKTLVKIGRLQGQQDALAYAIALMDNPYGPDASAVTAEATRIAA